jgi:AP-1 complex subunit beta-1
MGGFGAPAPAPAPQASNLPVICTAQQGKGMEIKGHLVRRNGETVYDFVISNQTQQPLSGFAIQFNKNLFSVMPGTIPAITGSFIDATRALAFARVSLASSFSPTRQLTLVNLCPHLSASSSATRRRQ